MSLAIAPDVQLRLGQDHPELPWWALGLLELTPGTPEFWVREAYESVSHLPSETLPVAEQLAIWDVLVRRALRLAGGHDPLDVARQEPELCRRVALRSPRAFAELCGLQTLDGAPLQLQWFHVRTIGCLRGHSLSIVLLPAQHGKSWLSTMVIPLLDWADQPEAVEIRVYQKKTEFAIPLTRQLMAEVEGNQAIKVLFPAIRRPERGDSGEKMWSTNGFSIGGKRAVEYSFRPMTPGMSTVGIRGWRVIGDDWVTEGNCASTVTQDRFYNYAHTGVMTMRQQKASTVRSANHVRWGTAGFVGTIYDRRDYLARLAKEWRERRAAGDRERKVLRFSVYPHRTSRREGEVLWPAERPLAWVQKEEADLGKRGFRMRYLNMPMLDSEVVFREQSVRDACSEQHEFGVAPQGARLIIGYDPANGRRTLRSKYPAAVVLGFVTLPGDPPRQVCHIVEWARWSVPHPEQVRRLIEWSRRHECAVVVEDNATQRSYADWIHELAPEVRVISHSTGNVKHDSRDGVESFQPLFDNGLVVIHARGAAQADLRALADEWIEWPQGRYTDLVMACWIARYQFKLLDRTATAVRPTVRPLWQERIPGRYLVDLSAYR